jgi:hypothetical protein
MSLSLSLSLCDLPLELQQAIWAHLPNRDLVTVMCVSSQLKASVCPYDLRRREWLTSTVDALAFAGDVEGVRFVWADFCKKYKLRWWSRRPPPHATWAMVNACRFGHLALVEFLCERMHFSIHEFNIACAKGHLAVVQFLHGRRDTHKMSLRVYEDYYLHAQADTTLYYIYDYEDEGDDTDETNAMDGAAQNGHLAVVQFLHQVGMPYTTYAMDFAAGEGHLDVVRFLHDVVGANCTANALDHACRMGHLPVVEYLLAKDKPHTVWALDYACANGHVSILQHFQRLGKLNILYGAGAACSQNQIGVLQFLAEAGIFKDDPTILLELFKQTLRMGPLLKLTTRQYVHGLIFLKK